MTIWPYTADRHGRDPAQRTFCLGKIATARFFAGEVLPLLAAQRARAVRQDGVLTYVPDEAW